MSWAGEKLRVLYVAVQMPDYPRNYRVRQYLKSTFDAQVVVVPLSPKPGFVRHCIELLVAGARAKGKYDVVILSELSLPFAFISWLLAKRHRAPHVVDFFVGLYETHVEDRHVVDARSPRARAYRLLEHIAARSADLLLADTDVRAEALSSRFDRPVINLPVGAPSWATALRPRAQRAVDSTRLLYYGNFIPLHGTPALVEALGLVARSHDFTITMIGDGDHRALVEETARRIGVSDRVRFQSATTERQLCTIIGNHDIVLGIFGTSPKASSVIANKVWQGLACGRVVITRESEALREILPLVGDQLRLTHAGSVDSIAQALRACLEEGPQEYVGSDSRLEMYVQHRYAALGDWLISHAAGTARRNFHIRPTQRSTST